MIDQNLLVKNKEILQKEKIRLESLLGNVGHREREVESSEEYATDFPNMGDSEEDNASEVELYEANLGERKTLESKLQSVNSAIERIAQGTYGTCAIGGEPIDEARLRVAPEATVCVTHAGKK